nr:LysR substrate-binding domain-containing protein [Marinibactrum halimedae]
MKRGKLSIAAMSSYAASLLPRVVVNYQDQHPDINLCIHDVIAEDVVELVRGGRVEMGVCFDPGPCDDLVFEELFTDAFMAVFPKGHKFDSMKEITWSQLMDEHFIALQKPSSTRLYIEKILAEYDISFAAQTEANQLSTIGRMVSAGVGVSVVPQLCEAQMRDMNCACRTLKSPQVALPVGLLHRRRYSLSAAAEAMRQSIVQEHLEAKPAMINRVMAEECTPCLQ